MSTHAPHPAWTEDDALLRAGHAADFYAAHSTQLAEALPTNFLDVLNVARAALGDTTALRALNTQKVATTALHEASHKGHALVLRVRAAIAHEDAPTLHTALGIGDNLDKDDTHKVRAKLETLVEHGPELLAHGVPAAIIASAATLGHTLSGNTTAQALTFTQRHQTTTSRAAAHLSLEHGVKQLATRGALVFLDHPALVAELDALTAHAAPADPVAPPASAPASPPAPAKHEEPPPAKTP